MREEAGVDDIAVRVTALRKSFGFRVALAGIDLRVERGEFLALFGPNGAGKTTLLKCIAGLARPSEGTARVFGADPRRDVAVRRRIGLVSHAGFLHEALSARENLHLYGSLYDVPKLDARIEEVLSNVGMTERAGEPIRHYSRGMRQRVAIARAILHDPDLLLLDEPFTGLDRAAAQALAGQLSSLVGEHHTIVLVTHEFEETLALASRAAVLIRGRVALDRPLADDDRGRFVDEYLELASARGQSAGSPS